MNRWKNHEGRYMLAVDATFQVTVDKLPLLFVGIISPTDGFLPVLAGIQDRLDTDTFRIVFQWISENGFPAPTAIMADGDKATRKAIKEIWPEVDLCMCWYHVKKNCRRELGKHYFNVFAPNLVIRSDTKIRFDTKNIVFTPKFTHFSTAQVSIP